MLDPGRVPGSVAKLRARGRSVTDRRLDLRNRPRDDQPEKEPDYHSQTREVKKDSRCPRNAVRVQPLDSRPHRGREREPQEEEEDEQPQVPERQGAGDDSDNDHARDERSSRSTHTSLTAGTIDQTRPTPAYLPGGGKEGK